MAGTPRKVLISGITDDDVRQIAASLNQLITDFDGHTHGGVTAGAANTAAPTATTAGKITDTLTGNVVVP